MAKFNRKVSRVRRHTRIRSRVQGTESRPRLCVFRSLTNIYSQVIDDTKGITLASASSLDEEIQNAAGDKKKAEVSKLEFVGASRRRTGRELPNFGFSARAPSNPRSSDTASPLRPLGASRTSCAPPTRGCRSTPAPFGNQHNG